VSRIPRRLVAVVALGLCASTTALAKQTQGTTTAPGKTTSGQVNQQKLFSEGEAALRDGDLDRAERAFKAFINADPQYAPAYANLGVVYMRRKQWDDALKVLDKAAKLAPKLTGIRLNIGLAYYRKGDFRHAIPPLESVVKDQPDSDQARYLLGLCYFYTERWVEATDALEPLWPAHARDMNFLYVLSLAAEKAERKELSERAAARMMAVGDDTPEFHLMIGRAKLNEEAYDDAIQELSTAAKGNPKLPFVHYYLGLAYEKKGNYPASQDEFLKDIALEPDVIFNYDELGNVYFLTNKDAEAEKAFRHALQLDGTLLSAHLGLAKLYQRQGQNEKALTELDAAARLDPQSSNIPYLRGQVLIKMGRTEEGRREVERSVAMSHERREQRRQELEGPGPIPDSSPE